MDYKKKENMYSEEGVKLQQYNKFFVNKELSDESSDESEEA